MSEKIIELQLNKHQYAALSDVLEEQNTDIRTVMQEKLTELYIQTVPQQERMEIDDKIKSERLAAEQQAQEQRHFSAYHVTESGSSRYFESDITLDLMQLARLLQQYRNGELRRQSERFDLLFGDAIPINQERFEECVGMRMDNTCHITGGFDIDFDRQMLSGVHIMDGWKSYSMADTDAAAVRAYREGSLSEDARWRLFLDDITGRELKSPLPLLTEGNRRLTGDDIVFSDEIMETDKNLNFYINVPFNVDEIFGTHVETANNDDWINVYANYDTVYGQVCDTLDIVLNRGDGSCEDLAYRLDDHEKEFLLSKMRDYCMKQEGMTLEDYSLQLQEESEPLTGPATQQM